jgi:ferredoxin--NADP+ reductase
MQAKCSPAELKELGEIEGVDVVVDPEDLILSPSDDATLARDRQTARNLDILRGFAETPPTNPRRVHLRFLVSPVEVLGRNGAVRGLRLERNELRHADDGSASVVGTGQLEDLDVSLIIRAIGYRSIPLPGVPFDERRGLIPNEKGQVIDPDTGSPVSREYVVGWAKRGPQGLIGSNKGDAAETVATVMTDLPGLGLNPTIDPDPDAVLEHARGLGIRYTEFDHWQLLDRLETDRGEAEGRPRVKFVRTEDMLRELDGSEESE